jgi:glycine dehydrogenase
MPGRIVGVSIDATGKPALRWRCRPASSTSAARRPPRNICTAQVLLAVMARMYAVYHGPEGLRAIAERVARASPRARRASPRLGCRCRTSDVRSSTPCGLAEGRRPGRRADRRRAKRASTCATSATAARRRARRDRRPQPTCTTSSPPSGGSHAARLRPTRPRSPRRSLRAQRLPHSTRVPRYRSETRCCATCTACRQGPVADDVDDPARLVHDEAQRHHRDDPGHLAGLRRAAPVRAADQAKGYQSDVRPTSNWLCEITGFARCSLQPNAGSQGEYAGLLVIRAYHRPRARAAHVCLIPESAHGTNPASASMAA